MSFERTIALIGDENFQKLTNKRVIIFGIGGVGGYALEAIARAGIIHITIVDDDTISSSNINRQILALESTVGAPKVTTAKKRIHDINPLCEVTARNERLTQSNIDSFELKRYDFIVDAIDFVEGKVALAAAAERDNIPIISAMGTGNKTSTEGFTITDIYSTKNCPLARALRHNLRAANVKALAVLYSPILPTKVSVPPASISYVPAFAGLLLAEYVITSFLKAE